MDDYQKFPIVCRECFKPIDNFKKGGCVISIPTDLLHKKSNITEVIQDRLNEGNICYLPSGVEFYGYICKDCLNKK